MRRTQPGCSGAARIAYGCWTILSLLLVGGTFLSLRQPEQTETAAVLARAEAGASAIEQAMLRVIEAAQTVQALAQTRLRLGEAHSPAGVAAIEQQMRDTVHGQLGIVDAAVMRRGRIDWSSLPAADISRADLARMAAIGEHGLHVASPAFGEFTRRWEASLSWPLTDRNGAAAGSVMVWLDPLALSAMIGTPITGEAVDSAVQRRSDGAFLAYSGAYSGVHGGAPGGAQGGEPRAAFVERPSTSDPAFAGAMRRSGQLHDLASGVDRLVGMRAPEAAPLVITQSFDASTALLDFFRLRAIILDVMLALIVGTFIATRLFLANYLLRKSLTEQAMIDPLTGLYNRRYFAEVLSRIFESARRDGLFNAVLLVDLDGFKQVNDARGHPVGDALLRQVADRLVGCVGEEDRVIRLGGDEFAIVRLSRQQRRDSFSLARCIVAELSKPYAVEGYHLRISASIGIALYPSGGEELGDLLRNADVALYFVKAAGGDAYRLFDPAMEETVRVRRELETDLREALGRGELEVFYQPLVQLDPRRVSGFEALLRWHHPVLGMVMPGRFIPVAEETGMIAPIGEWVLREACREATKWPPGTRVAVNLSPVQFERSDIVEIVASALLESRLEPGLLELEITEGVVMLDMGDVLLTMQRLQALGVRLALDDFGTGYSSLSYLRRFPFDKVKIDASFLADLRGGGGTIIRAVLGMCGHLGLDTLVEGVETEEQLHWLRAEGCAEVQGHLFSPPRCAAGVPAIIAGVIERAQSEAAARRLPCP